MLFLFPNLFSICPTASLHSVHPYGILSNHTRSHFVSFHVSFVSFSPHVSPFSRLQSNPFTLPSNSLGHPRVLSAFFHLSISLSPLPLLLRLLLSVSSLSLPLSSAHLQHIKIPLFFLQRIVQSLWDLLHSSMLLLPLCLHICLPLFLSVLAALHSSGVSLSCPLSF